MSYIKCQIVATMRRHPKRWYKVRTVRCAINHAMGEHYNDRQVRDALNSMTPLVLEKIIDREWPYCSRFKLILYPGELF